MAINLRSADPRWPTVWGDGHLFAFSGMEGPTTTWTSLVASTLGQRPGYWLHSNVDRWSQRGVNVQLVQRLADGRYLGTFADWQTVTILATETDQSALLLESKNGTVSLRYQMLDRSTLGVTAGGTPGLYLRLSPRDETWPVRAVEGGGVVWGTNEAFAACSGPGSEETAQVFDGALWLPLGNGIAAVCWMPGQPTQLPDLSTVWLLDWQSQFAARQAWLRSRPLPSGLTDRMTRAARRAYLTLKVNTNAPEERMTIPWSTPDRWPHRHCYLWDTAMAAYGYGQLDPAWGRWTLAAMFCQQREDGFVPSMLMPHYDGARGRGPSAEWDLREPEPQTNCATLAWQAWETYLDNGDRQLLETLYPLLKRYLTWLFGRADAQWGGLLRDARFSHGMDNSPRFDNGPPAVYADMNLFACHDALHLERIARELGHPEEAEQWSRRRMALADRINERLWDCASNFYYDLRPDETFVRIRTPVGLVALSAQVAQGNRVDRLVERLLDPRQFWTPLPVPSVARDEPTYAPNMWRGPVWTVYSMVAYRGLQAAGCNAEARMLLERVLEQMLHWHDMEGTYYEFYDADGRIPPSQLSRKRTVDNLRDYNWFASYTLYALRKLHTS